MREPRLTAANPVAASQGALLRPTDKRIAPAPDNGAGVSAKPDAVARGGWREARVARAPDKGAGVAAKPDTAPGGWRELKVARAPDNGAGVAAKPDAVARGGWREARAARAPNNGAGLAAKPDAVAPGEANSRPVLSVKESTELTVSIHHCYDVGDLQSLLEKDARNFQASNVAAA